MVFRDVTVEIETDEEAEEVTNDYQLLPTSNDQDVEFGITTFDGNEFHTFTSSNYHDLTCPTESPSTENSSSTSELTLDPIQVETIKSIMSNIKIPNSAIPSWAHTVTDDQLKQVVDEKVTKKNSENWAVFD